MSVSTPKIIRYAVIVGIAALIGWLMVEPMNRAQERAKIDAAREMMQDLPGQIEGLGRSTSPDGMSNPFKAMRDMSKSIEKMKREMKEKERKAGGNPYLAISIVTMIVGAMLGVGLALADEFGSFSAKRLGVRAATGALVGAVGGFFAGLIAQFIFGLLTGGSSFGLGIIMLILARSIGWAVAGAAIGVSAGAASGSVKLGLQGMAGGAIGGGAGGFFFDLLSSIGQMPDIMNMSGYQYATAGRLFAGTLMGVCIGAAVAMVQEYTKQAWITVLVGRNEGRDYIRTKPITSIGRDELADIPLFGDKNVEKQHATITESMNVHTIKALGPLSVNNQPVSQAQLRDGDLITIGRFNLRFTTRAIEAFTFSSPSSSSQNSQQPYAPTQAYKPQTYTAGTNVVPRLRGVNGLLDLSAFDIRSARVTIGRDTSCDISLTQDTSVSRNHAEITYENGRYMLRDLGSTNGVYVNGARINEASITPMDIIQIGGTQFQLVFESPGT